VLTLVAVPSLYLIVNDAVGFIRWFRRDWNESSKTVKTEPVV